MARKKAEYKDKEIRDDIPSYRVKVIDKDGKQTDTYLKDEEKAKELYYSIEFPNKVKELDIIVECKFITMLWEKLTK